MVIPNILVKVDRNPSNKQCKRQLPSTKHPWMKGIQVCSNEGLCPFLMGNNNEIAKIH